jgi:hypothetical protein
MVCSPRVLILSNTCLQNAKTLATRFSRLKSKNTSWVLKGPPQSKFKAAAGLSQRELARQEQEYATKIFAPQRNLWEKAHNLLQKVPSGSLILFSLGFSFTDSSTREAARLEQETATGRS